MRATHVLPIRQNRRLGSPKKSQGHLSRPLVTHRLLTAMILGPMDVFTLSESLDLLPFVVRRYIAILRAQKLVMVASENPFQLNRHGKSVVSYSLTASGLNVARGLMK